MHMADKLVKNAAGRMVVTELNGEPAIPYMGVGKYHPGTRNMHLQYQPVQIIPSDGNKQVRVN